jgi:hypothetical protein
MRKMMEKFDAYSIRVHSPSGSVFVVVNELAGRVDNVQLYLGKSGSMTFASTAALGELINLALSKHASIEDVISTLSNITSDKLVYHGEITIRSEIDAVVSALMTYKKYRGRDVNRSREILRPRNL